MQPTDVLFEPINILCSCFSNKNCDLCIGFNQWQNSFKLMQKVV